MPVRSVMFVFALAFCLGCPAACGRPSAAEPVDQVEWRQMGKLRQWGLAPDGFFAISTEYRLSTWAWSGASVSPDPMVQLPVILHPTLLPDDLFLAEVKSDAGYPLTLLALPDDVVKQWESPNGWWVSHTGSSRNGRFACILLSQEIYRPAPGLDMAHLRHRVGVIEVEERQVRWVAELVGPGEGTIRQICVSDDGRHIAVSGWRNGVAMVDASQQEVIWDSRPQEAVSLGAAVFSADGTVLYAADDGGGCLYALDTRTGNVLHRRYASVTGKEIHSHRISCLAISPDDAWIAAGTGPEGQVFVFSTAAAGAKPLHFPHGLSTVLIVSFSPDSQHLASVAGGIIKIWRVAGP